MEPLDRVAGIEPIVIAAFSVSVFVSVVFAVADSVQGEPWINSMKVRVDAWSENRC